jgi:glutamate synthase (NADPH/NADH) large chain
VLYGATSGRAFFAGRAGERFGVRNSGAMAVVEGTGDHGCEYMTGGVVVVLGPTGRNFGAGMSGGHAFVLDADHSFVSRCNMGMVGVEALGPNDETVLRELVEEHVARTGSARGQAILAMWADSKLSFKKVIPTEYKRVLEARAAAATATDDAVAADGTVPPPRPTETARHLKLVKR